MHSLTSALDGGEWSSSRFIPRERAPGTHSIGGWVVPKDVLDTVVKRKISSINVISVVRCELHISLASSVTWTNKFCRCSDPTCTESVFLECIINVTV
jgi:hypothetical protein